MTPEDRELGLDRPIARRDFIQGVSVAAIGATLGGGCTTSNELGTPLNAPYPPALTGLRGAHAGSFETAHALGLGAQRWPQARDTGEAPYDLIVVGAGISGLAAAWEYQRQREGRARILLLDNHDDFGGHAKRNEFSHRGHTRMAWGGAVNMEFPSWGTRALATVTELGVDIQRLLARQEFEFGGVHDMGRAIYFDRRHFGEDRLVAGTRNGMAPQELAAALEQFPLERASREAFKGFLTDAASVLGKMGPAQKLQWLREHSYIDFLSKAGAQPAPILHLMRNASHGLWGANTDTVPAMEAFANGAPGLHRVGKLPHVEEFEGLDGMAMFPDGNATLARLFVSALIPAVAPGPRNQEEIATRHFDYTQLDREHQPVRLRLNSTAVDVRARRLASDLDGVRVRFVRDAEAHQVYARDCILACNHNIIPWLCKDMPQAQKTAMGYGERCAMLITNVLLDNARAVQQVGYSGFQSPARRHASAFLASGLDLGGYQPGWDPDAPAVMQFYGAMAGPSDDYDAPFASASAMKEQMVQGRQRMLSTSFEQYEREVREHLGGMLGAGGFDPARDIAAITVNRWPHGYAYEYTTSNDPEWAAGQAPHELARQRFGRIAIANSDAGAHAYADGAIDQAHRAVDELLGEA